MSIDFTILVVLAAYFVGLGYIKYLEIKYMKEHNIQQDREWDAEMRRERFKRGENATWSHDRYRGEDDKQL